MSRRLLNTAYTTYDFMRGSGTNYNYDSSGSNPNTYDNHQAPSVREDWQSHYDHAEIRRDHEDWRPRLDRAESGRGHEDRYESTESRRDHEDWRPRLARAESARGHEDWRSRAQFGRNHGGRHSRVEYRRDHEDWRSRLERANTGRDNEDSRYDRAESGRDHGDRHSRVESRLDYENWHSRYARNRLESQRSPDPLARPPMATSPLPEYLLESEKASARLAVPTEARKLLILDLNGTLVYRTPRTRREFRPHRRHAAQMNDHQYTDSDPSHSTYAPPPMPTPDRPLRTVHPRPYMRAFREYLFHPSTCAWLDTMVWSSAQPHSVADMVERCFGSQREELLAVWARDTLGLEERDYHRKTQTTKDLSKPWSKLSIDPSSLSTPLSDSDTPQAHSAHTTLLMDDSPRKAYLQPYNHLCVREYTSALRQIDLECRQREQRLRQILISQSQADTEPTPETRHALPPTSSDDASPIFPRLSPSSTSTLLPSPSKKTRKATIKHAKHGQKPAELEDELNHELGEYDPTLLAVVGVLERIKWEGNVAGWVRSGGLVNSYIQEAEAIAEEVAEGEKGESKDKGEKEQQEVGVQDEAEKGMRLSECTSALQDPKRRRVSDKEHSPLPLTCSNDGEPISASFPSSSPFSAAAPTTALETVGDTGQWFEDKTVLRFWVQKGVKALGGLGIEVGSGIVG